MHVIAVSLACLSVLSTPQSSNAQAGNIQTLLGAVRAIAEKATADSVTTGRPVDLEGVAAAQAEQARVGVAGLDATSVAADDLPALAELYLFAGQLEQGRRAFGPYLRETNPARKQRSDAMYTGLLAALLYVRTQTAEAFAEGLLQELDALTDPAALQSTAMGHYQAALYYRETRRDELRIEHHASRFLDLFGKLPPPDRTKLLPMALNVHANYAWVLADRGDRARALVLLSEAAAIGGDVPGADVFLKAQLRNVGLIGRPAPAVQGDVWLNTPAEVGPVTLKGRVRLVVFTAHWCRTCVPTYQLLKDLMDAYGKKGLGAILVTRVWGFIPDARGAQTPSPEVEFDRRYYLTNHKVTFPLRDRNLRV